MRGPARRKVVDKVAAAVILQAWLDARAGEPSEDLARERPRPAAPSRIAGATSLAARARSSQSIDDVDSLDELDLLDWSTDPWDEAPGRRLGRGGCAPADQVDQVGRLHGARCW